MNEGRENVRVIDPVPPRRTRGPFRWSIALLLLVAWLGMLIATALLKMRTLMVLTPLILVVLLIYLLVCTMVAIRSKAK